MTSPDAAAPADWSARADEAARSVTRMFGQRLFFLPGTHIAAIERPSSRLKNLRRPWHYWWQAHYVDCLVDAGRRELARGARFDGGNRPSAGRLASQLVTGIRLRNFLTFVNNYYDDMAWLALSTLRLEKLAEETRKPGSRRHARIRQSLTLQFDSASTDDLGGGTFWSKKRDFKNTPATAPVALYYARTGNAAKAQALVDWLHAKLFDPAQGMYQDGLRIGAGGEVVLEAAIYTYNQGPVLGALLELGGQGNLDRAAALVDAVSRNLTRPATLASGRTAAVLRCDGTGDGGLFTGILARYLALAAVDGRLPDRTRAIASTLVAETAQALWEGRRAVDPKEPLARHGAHLVFPLFPETPAGRSYPAGAAVELSTQLQAWMVLEAAAAVQAAGHGTRPGAPN
ncbi:putative alpha-1,6-mannanase (GH76 family) [Arthrobacter sp. PvP102]|uniref:glycoside hydrolase family 76 protein n=1 Tax=unclassified Arthrobacter TaxID=235627 RepID=UPI001AEA0CDB|nr:MULTISPECIES: glycoside hydrolase family 76 protein [unclassified Arthrobacter]MBP1234148.1 putative alpha-1,6-mannanase (GH76 family) [Arthrobacter sp. PvP103]MBP1239282.1 putative alpha-1,6-mannanase (GH76 family) [Arthrobacter sp. PvP102]